MTYTREQLQSKTVKQLKSICSQSSMKGRSKVTRKADIITFILNNQVSANADVLSRDAAIEEAMATGQHFSILPYEYERRASAMSNWTSIHNVLVGTTNNTISQPEDEIVLDLDAAKREEEQAIIDQLNGLANYNMTELKVIARYYGVPKYSKLTKAGIIHAIQAHTHTHKQAL